MIQHAPVPREIVASDDPAQHAERRWQEELGDLVTDPRELIRLLELDPAQLPAALRASGDFALRVPRPFLSRMTKGDPQDPLLLQVLPGAPELEPVPGFTPDPLGEGAANPVPGVVHKYRGRLLLIAAGQCAVNCRYCFRRLFPYGDNHLSRSQWQGALDYIRGQRELREVILSGGDPLVLGDRQLQWVADQLAAIPQLATLRVHTRLPIVAPARVTDELLGWLTGSRLKPVLVLHCNHANEIDQRVHAALQKLRSAGVTLLNQAVLLRGVNDSEEALAQLSERLFEAGVLPYYLHQLDRVQGAAHFEITDDRALALVAAIRKRLPGYLVPTLVREIAGEASKTPI
ncbi:EF-P beta-lysylation protein EpmB [Microbulbifer flavimaris]|uniref:L-lysine 2,3-aminomutase n=1 Tax=Microbulbifer flavimaris TaxID=1781068 RepID=A0ABX4HY69_9GAMM|nr:MULTISPECIES: EF-P beta-lysylation protein EpmB [Microbulbifer]KUJ82829.1 EF-P beta-lysylation protein EpmB [Microbulbifer sp. ZGT114]PCO05006.1 EF-P beta-lysylation protein EpmB [Microbulbifer flavimaris]